MICQHCGAVIDQRTWYPLEHPAVVVYARHGEALRAGAQTDWFRLDDDGTATPVNVCRKNAPSNAHEPR